MHVNAAMLLFFQLRLHNFYQLYVYSLHSCLNLANPFQYQLTKVLRVRLICDCAPTQHSFKSLQSTNLDVVRFYALFIVLLQCDNQLLTSFCCLKLLFHVICKVLGLRQRCESFHLAAKLNTFVYTLQETYYSLRFCFFVFTFNK